MPLEEEERFQLSNICWIYDKLFDVGDDGVRDHCNALHTEVVISILN